MRRLVSLVLLSALLALAGSALPCAADDGCCDEQGRQGELPMDRDCTCCVQLARVVVPDATPAPAPDAPAVAMTPRSVVAPSSPDPREILHVPKPGASTSR